jgi:SAM-dependent methyltransferase
MSEFRLSEREVRRIRRERRHPRPTQFDYLHVKSLVDAVARAFAEAQPPVNDVLDVYCGTKPYADLLPAGARCVGLDTSDVSDAVDVVSDEFLPFEDESFDLVFCTEGFDYVPDPARGVAELRRVLRPGGTVVLTVSLVWEYNRTILQHRWSGPGLAALFDGWDDVELVENGGFAVSWSTLTGRIVSRPHEHLPRPLRTLSRPVFALVYLGINGVGWVLDRLERRLAGSPAALPMNFLLTARRPPDGEQLRDPQR